MELEVKRTLLGGNMLNPFFEIGKTYVIHIDEKVYTGQIVDITEQSITLEEGKQITLQISAIESIELII